MILVDSNQKLFTLHTAHSTYQMKVDAYGFLLHTYYGSRVENTDMSYTIQCIDRGFSGNPYDAGLDRTYSLDVLPQEYSTFGEGDYRIPALQVVNADGSFDCDLRYRSYTVQKGKPALCGLPATYGTEEAVETLKIILEDPVSHLQVHLFYSVFEAYDVIARHVECCNASSAPIQLQKVSSMSLDFHNAQDMEVLTFYGKHAFERALERTPARHGKIAVESVRGASSHQQNPFVILCDRGTAETAGSCWGFSLVYSGNFLAEAELDPYEQIRFVMGIHPTAFTFVLQPNDCFTAPEVVMSYSETGLGQLSRNYHKLYRSHLCRGPYQHKRRPILINNWEATYFAFDDDKLVQIAEEAAQLGIEMLVMDDGWFGKRDDDFSGLGDWVVNPNKIKGGLVQLVERIHALGMQFGIWFEPEMVSEDSDLYRRHPDWCLRTQGRPGTRGRHQYVLDLSRPEVVDYLFEAMRAILESADIAYVKWDMNRHLANVWSAALPAERQGEVYHRYVLGVYALLERLLQAFPNLLLEGCSGGGGRFDAGMLYYSPQIWCSDNTDAIDRISIQYGTSFGYPVSAVGSHVSACPNHQTGRVTPLNTRGVVAMSGTFGYELDISKMTGEEKETVKQQIAAFKRYSDLIREGDYYRLTNPFENRDYAAWQFVSEDKAHALVNFVLLRAKSNPPIVTLKLLGLDEQAQYRINGEQMLSGAALRYAGLPIPVLYGDFAALQFELVRVEDEE